MSKSSKASKSIWNIEKNTSVKDKIVNAVISRIIDGHLKAGDTLPPENILCSEMQVSRVSLREAIKQLEALGFLQVNRGNGTVVKMPDFGIIQPIMEFLGKTKRISLKDFHDFRSLIEVEAVGLATLKDDPQLIKKLDGLLKDAELSAGDEFSYVELDFKFHKAILEAVPNKLYVMILAPLDAYLKKSRQLSFVDVAAAGRTLKVHRAIFVAMLNKDAAKAKELMAKHLRQTAEDLNIKE